MPVRSLHSSVLVWPNEGKVREAVNKWAELTARKHPELRGLGYFGSYARGDWGVGSDLDVVLVVEHSHLPRERRSSQWETGALPVPVDLFIYTKEEWENLLRRNDRFARTLIEETRWVYRAPKGDAVM